MFRTPMIAGAANTSPLLTCAVFTVAVFITGCASDPIVDQKGVNPQKYEADLAECRVYAEAVNTPAEGAKNGAIGAVVGGTLGAIFGDHHSAGRGAGGGAVFGAVKGAEKAEDRKERVLFNCMKGRGYQVLG